MVVVVSVVVVVVSVVVVVVSVVVVVVSVVVVVDVFANFSFDYVFIYRYPNCWCDWSKCDLYL